MDTADIGKGKVNKLFFIYVAQNIMGIVGMSAYYFADTYFIAKAAGADGLTALNLILPFFYFIYAIGDMLGIGAATRFTIERARGNKDSVYCLGNALFYAGIVSAGIFLAGCFFAEELLRFCGADDGILAVGGTYLKIVLMSAWAFMAATILNSFIRNDGAPRLSMIAMLVSAAYNVIFDYVFIFVLEMGMPGAALATVTAPMLGALICLTHFFSAGNTLQVRVNSSVQRICDAVRLGTSAFMGEMSSCVLMVLYNSLFLLYAGNEGVAAYGIIANLATMASAVFTGITQGVQPLMSYYHGIKDYKRRYKVLRLSFLTSFVMAGGIIFLLNLFCSEVVGIFNRDGNVLLAEYAMNGIRYYFIGFIFLGFNVTGASFMSAVEASGWAGVISFLRGFVFISIVAVILPKFIAMTGIWISFPVSEFLTTVVVMYALQCVFRHEA